MADAGPSVSHALPCLEEASLPETLSIVVQYGPFGAKPAGLGTLPATNAVND